MPNTSITKCNLPSVDCHNNSTNNSLERKICKKRPAPITNEVNMISQPSSCQTCSYKKFHYVAPPQNVSITPSHCHTCQNSIIPVAPVIPTVNGFSVPPPNFNMNNQNNVNHSLN